MSQRDLMGKRAGYSTYFFVKDPKILLCSYYLYRASFIPLIKYVQI